MVFPFLLSHYLPPCGNITFQIGLGKLHGRMSSNLSGMYIILHFDKPNIHNLLVASTMDVPGFGQLKSRILGWSSFEGRNQLIEVEPFHFEEDFQLFMGELNQALLLLFIFELIVVLPSSWFLLPNWLWWDYSVFEGFFEHGLLCLLTVLLGCHPKLPKSESSLHGLWYHMTRSQVPS